VLLEKQKTGEKTDYQFGIGGGLVREHDYYRDFKKLEQLMGDNKKVAVFGNSSNQNDFTAIFDNFFLLQCNAETLKKRLNTRTNNEFGKEKM